MENNSNNIIKILIVEDEEINYLYISTVIKNIKNRQIEIFHAKNGKEAIRIFQDTSGISLVFMDLKMPVMDGYEAAKKLKELNPTIPVIAQTAYSVLEDKQRAKEVGIVDFLSKPIDKEDLIATIDKHFKQLQ